MDAAAPTAADIALTGRIRELARQLGLDLIEHVIVSRIAAYSNGGEPPCPHTKPGGTGLATANPTGGQPPQTR